nr:MAG TPA: hypothetical protein [Caudoviricetes sp.]
MYQTTIYSKPIKTHRKKHHNPKTLFLKIQYF